MRAPSRAFLRRTFPEWRGSWASIDSCELRSPVAMGLDDADHRRGMKLAIKGTT
jgi:hypothetical protein